jgi:hypothetical protein
MVEQERQSIQRMILLNAATLFSTARKLQTLSPHCSRFGRFDFPG